MNRNVPVQMGTHRCLLVLFGVWSCYDICMSTSCYLIIMLTTLLPYRVDIIQDQCCCPQGKSLSSRILEDQFLSPCPRKFKSSKIFEDWVGYLCQHFVLG